MDIFWKTLAAVIISAILTLMLDRQSRDYSLMVTLAASAMEAEASAEELVHTVFPHPTVSESLGEAFHAAWNGSAIHNVS